MGASLVLAYDVLRPEEKLICKAAERLGVKVQLINVTETPLPCDCRCDAAVIRPVSMFRALHAAAALWSEGVVVVNDWYTIMTSGDKVLAYAILRREGVPVPRSLYALSSRSLLKAASSMGFPLVDKPAYGSWGRLVSLIESYEVAKIVAEHREWTKSPLLQHHVVQEFIECGGTDIRCIIAFGELLGCMRRKAAAGEWRSNLALGGSAEPYKPDAELAELAIRASKPFRGFFVSVDFLHDRRRGYLVNEVNGVPEFKGFIKATGVDVAEALVRKIIEYAKK